MFLPVVVIFLAIYWTIAWFYLRWARARGTRFPLFRAWVVCLTLLFGDHVAGYLLFRLYTSTISVPGPVALAISDIAVEDYAQDAVQKEDEGGSGSGDLPLFAAVNAARYIAIPVQYSDGTGSLLADITTGLSRLEVVDLRYHQQHPNEPPRVKRYSIVKRPDQRCHDFETQDSARRKAQFESMVAHGLVNVENYCIANEITHQVTARYTEKRFSADDHHPRIWTLPALLGTYLSKSQIIDNQTGQVVYEGKSARFYGGWVWQFLRFFPDMNYEVASAWIKTKGVDEPCCPGTRTPVTHLLPYEISP